MHVLLDINALMDTVYGSILERFETDKVLDMDTYRDRITHYPKPFSKNDFDYIWEHKTIKSFILSEPTVLNMGLPSILSRVSTGFNLEAPTKITILLEEYKIDQKSKELIKAGIKALMPNSQIAIKEKLDNDLLGSTSVYFTPNLDFVNNEELKKDLVKGRFKELMVMTPYRISEDISIQKQTPDDIKNMLSMFFKVEFLKPSLFSVI